MSSTWRPARTWTKPRVGELLARQQACIGDCLARAGGAGLPAPAMGPISRDDEREALTARFRREFFPLLTPRAITMSPGPPVSRSSPRSRFRWPWRCRASDTGPLHFAYLRLPSDLPRFVELPAAAELVPVEEIVLANLALLYPDRDHRGGRTVPGDPEGRSRDRGGRGRGPASGDRGGARPAGGQSGRSRVELQQGTSTSCATCWSRSSGSSGGARRRRLGRARDSRGRPGSWRRATCGS